ncbi:hypothetical protein [Haloarcula sediminis]|uniref:hypothetical protein n=1 Tax=Haloarcula sediminis TaxID=3111777 RepID=UPI002D78D425|nr:hypothetical protein [Haloarcula sp. CK38]
MQTHDDTSDYFNNAGELTAPIRSRVSRTTSETITIHVPSDFDTVSEAIDEVKCRRTPPGVTVDIILESGHAFQSTVHLQQQDLRHVSIKSEDGTVGVDDTGLSDSTGTGELNMFVGYDGAHVPAIRTLFNASNASEKVEGLALGWGSHAHIGIGCGFEQMWRGVNAFRISTVTGWQSICRDMTERGVKLGGHAIGYFDEADLSGCGGIGMRLVQGAQGTLKDANASDCRVGVRPGQGSYVIAFRTDLTNCTDHGANLTASEIVMPEADVSGAGKEDVSLGWGSRAVLNDATTTNGTPDIGDVRNISAFNSAESGGIGFA